MSKNVFIKDLKEGQTFTDCFLVDSKKILATKSGKPYMALVFQDKTGSINAKIWDDAEKEQKGFSKNDFVKVEASVQSYQDSLQLNVKKIWKIEARDIDLSDFISQSKKNIEEMLNELMKISKEVKNPYFFKLLEAFFSDADFKEKFSQSPAAKQIHHVYLGGLLEHTLSVVKICYFLLKNHYLDVNFDLLITGAVLHDIGKINELELMPTIDYTNEGRLIGHIMIGFQMVQKKISAIGGFPENLALLLQHLILSHHGQYEWGSPKLPQTVEALILHYVDNLDAKLNSVQQLINTEIDTENSWTSYNKILGRQLFKDADLDKKF